LLRSDLNKKGCIEMLPVLNPISYENTLGRLLLQTMLRIVLPIYILPCEVPQMLPGKQKAIAHLNVFSATSYYMFCLAIESWQEPL
jgi:hypothetical protein